MSLGNVKSVHISINNYILSTSYDQIYIVTDIVTLSFQHYHNILHDCNTVNVLVLGFINTQADRSYRKSNAVLK